MAGKSMRVEGVTDIQRSLSDVPRESQAAIRIAVGSIAEIVADEARPDVPTKTGDARRSVRVGGSGDKAWVSGGGGRVRWFGWLDFGGPRRGRGGGIARRPYIAGGRYIWAAYGRVDAKITRTLNDSLAGALRRSGLEVTTGA